jgi:hypothetical protein
MHVVHPGDGSGSITIVEMQFPPPQPKPFSDRELTLKAITLSFQRARAAQRQLTGPQAGSQEATVAVADWPAGAPGVIGIEDDVIDTAGSADDEQGEAALPNPIVTDAYLRHYLEQATLYQGSLAEPTDAERRSRLFAGPRRSGSDQVRYNIAVVHAIHQLDHRTRLQQQTISELEAELADTRRALVAVEAERNLFS